MFGLHPAWVTGQPLQNVDDGLNRLRANISFARALGELGLDYGSSALDR